MKNKMHYSLAINLSNAGILTLDHTRIVFEGITAGN
jgi:hypothetical protein